jgi:hypothetical protein
MALLRKIDQHTSGNSQAWDDTYRNWEIITQFCKNLNAPVLREVTHKYFRINES